VPKVTIPYAKNIIRRALRELVDPSPDPALIPALWQHFDSSCAYCGARLVPGQKAAHTDHLLSASSKGPNHISNRVLSCARCNEVEKRDMPWENFLRTKCPDPATFEDRKSRILAWQRLHRQDAAAISQALLADAETMADAVVALFDDKVIALRTAKRQHPQDRVK
jgi:hypothetical protein